MTDAVIKDATAVHCAVELQSPVPDGTVDGRAGLHALKVWFVGGFVGVGNVGIVLPTDTDCRIDVMLPDAGAFRVQPVGAVAPQFAPVPALRTTLRVVAVHCAVELQSPVPEGMVEGLIGFHALKVWFVGVFVGVGNVGIVPPTVTD